MKTSLRISTKMPRTRDVLIFLGLVLAFASDGDFLMNPVELKALWDVRGVYQPPPTMAAGEN